MPLNFSRSLALDGFNNTIKQRHCTVKFSHFKLPISGSKVDCILFYCNESCILTTRPKWLDLADFSPKFRKRPCLTETGPGGVGGLILFERRPGFSGKCFHPGIGRTCLDQMSCVLDRMGTFVNLFSPQTVRHHIVPPIEEKSETDTCERHHSSLNVGILNLLKQFTRNILGGECMQCRVMKGLKVKCFHEIQNWCKSMFPRQTISKIGIIDLYFLQGSVNCPASSKFLQTEKNP